MKTEQLRIGPVDIEVRFKPIKNLHLSVHPPNGHVTISSPEFYDLEKVKIYAATKLGWIKAEQRKFRAQKREQPRLFINRESHYYLGSRYLMEVIESSKVAVKKDGTKLRLFVRKTDDHAAKKKVVYDFYRNGLREQVERYLEQYTGVMKVEIPEFSIRTMKTKWGSCSTNGRLQFNIELAKKPVDCIEYIVVHELVHLLERHHNKRFVLLMDQFLPAWRIQKKILNELPL